MQHVAGVLDAVLGRLLRGCEAVIPGAVEVLEAAAPVLQLVALAWHDGLLLGDTVGTGRRTRSEQRKRGRSAGAALKLTSFNSRIFSDLPSFDLLLRRVPFT